MGPAIMSLHLSRNPRILKSNSKRPKPDRKAGSIAEDHVEEYLLDPARDDETEASRIIEEAAQLVIPADVRLVELAHRRLYRIAVGLIGHARYSQTLGPTALVSEGFEKMFSSDQFAGIRSVAHFYARFTLCMKHAMIDYYWTKQRRRRATCRSLSRAAIERGERYRQGRFDKSSLQDPAYPLVEVADILAVMSAESAMARRAAQVFELQFFGALTVREMMNMMGVSQSTIEADLRYAKAFILEQLLPDELDAHDDAPTTD